MLPMILPTIWGTLVRYRAIIWVAALVIALGTVFVFYGNCRANSVALAEANLTVDRLTTEISILREELAARNLRIRLMNEQRLQELDKAEKLLAEAVAVGIALRNERDQMFEELEVTKFELLEAIRDDEEMADWVDDVVPSSAWRLLQQASDIRSHGMRTDN